MSEANTGDLTPPAEGAPATILTEGGASAPAAEGAASVAGETGPDSVAGETGADSVAGEESTAGEESQSAADYSTLKFSEGINVVESDLKEFTDFAQANNISPENAQTLVSLFEKQLTAQAQALVQSNLDAWKTQLDTWRADLVKDPQFQGEALKANLLTIGRSFDVYGSPELKEAFEVTGAGNNPHLVKYVLNMAKALDEGGLITAKGPAARSAQTLGDLMYGSAKEG